GTYREALGRADSLLGELIAHAGPDTAILVTTDHGGQGFSHSDPVLANMETFVVIRSARIQAGSVIAAGSVLDIAPTAMDLAGVASPVEWAGRSLLGTEEGLVRHLMSLLRALTEHSYGEGVSMLEHSLQAAALARSEAPDDAALTLAALFHDIGHLLGEAGEWGLTDHAQVGARYMQQWFPAEVVEPIRLHVDAKRWLVREEKDYLAQLSKASRMTLHDQGGPFGLDASATFVAQPHSGRAVVLRRWDDAAKRPDVSVDDVDVYQPLIERVLEPEADAFTAEWARDACRCDSCRDPATGQHLIDVSDLAGWRLEKTTTAADVRIATVVSDEGEVHRCLIPKEPAATSDPLVMWGAELAVPTHSEHDLDIAGLSADVTRFGIAVVTGLAEQEGAVLEFAGRLGFVRETNYGRMFDVVDQADANNLAYTSLGLPLHTDNPYREPVPTVQILHCINSPVSGGRSRFADGFAAASDLQTEFPNDFRTLSRTPVLFRFVDPANAVDLRASRPLIEVSATGRIEAVNVNHRSMEPPEPVSSTTNFYTAYRRFRDLIDSPTSVVERPLGPGELVIFDNRRVLHGRSSFRGGSGRHLQGCYVDMDAIRSLARATS
ncbi:MAG: TauD/TfdA family dioxygenase, partial [Acidimicrobiales bacterium]